MHLMIAPGFSSPRDRSVVFIFTDISDSNVLERYTYLDHRIHRIIESSLHYDKRIAMYYTVL